MPFRNSKQPAQFFANHTWKCPGRVGWSNRLQDVKKGFESGLRRGGGEARRAQRVIAALTDALRIDAGDLDLLEVVIPEAELDESAGEEPPVDSRWDWVEQTAT